MPIINFEYIKNYLYDNIIIRYKFYQVKKKGFDLKKIVDNNSSKYIILSKTGEKDIKIRYKDYNNLEFCI